MQFVILSRNGKSEIEDDGDEAFEANSLYTRGVERGQLSADSRSRETWVQRELARPGSIAAHLARTPVTHSVPAEDRASLAKVFGAPPAVAPPRRRETTTVERRARPRSLEALVASLEESAGLT